MELIPSKKQFNDWTLPSKITYISFVIGVFSFIIGVISLIIIFLPNKQSEYSDININKELENSNTSESKKQNTFYFVGIQSTELIKEIKEKGNLSIDENSVNKINISHTGEYILINNDYVPHIYKLKKGFLKIEIKSNCNEYLNNLIIPSMGPAPKHIIDENISIILDSLLDNNISLITKKILQCIKS